MHLLNKWSLSLPIPPYFLLGLLLRNYHCVRKKNYWTKLNQTKFLNNSNMHVNNLIQFYLKIEKWHKILFFSYLWIHELLVISKTLSQLWSFLLQSKSPTPFTFTFSLLPLPPLHCLYVPSLLTNSPKQLNQELSQKNLTKLHMTMFHGSSNTCSIKFLPSIFIFQSFESFPS